jgi:hypothetical protein
MTADHEIVNCGREHSPFASVPVRTPLRLLMLWTPTVKIQGEPYATKQTAMRADSLEAAGPSLELPAPLSWLRRSRVDLLLVLPFLVFLYVQLAHHQMWRDETNAWALSAGSRTLGELFYFVRNEAHPYLWYMILWIVSRFSASVVALKFVAALVGTCTYLVIALASPFSRLEKILLFCSYYISFEYAVLARMYGAARPPLYT